MELSFLCPFWGRESMPADLYMQTALEEGYQGIEINIPDEKEFTAQLLNELELVEEQHPQFVFAAQQVVSPATEPVAAYINRMLDRLETLARFHPKFINSHTGKDHYSFADNCRIIDAVQNFSQKRGIPVYHETHRGRFSFHLATLIPYLKAFPGLQLTADLSHFCVVSESLLEDQEHLIPLLFPHIRHLHARIGFSQSAQVNDPFAPEWHPVLNRYLRWWKELIEYRKKAGDRQFTITPEFGPPPYMPVLPFTQQPLANQWEVNRKIKDLLKDLL